jgi:hypothetical protein
MELRPAKAGAVRAVWRVEHTQVTGCASSVAYIHPYPGGYSPPENPYHSGIREEFSGCSVGGLGTAITLAYPPPVHHSVGRDRRA